MTATPRNTDPARPAHAPPDADAVDAALRASAAHAGSPTERMEALAFAAAGVVRAASEDELLAVLRESCARVLPTDAVLFGVYDPVEHTLRYLGGVDAGVQFEPRVVPVSGTPAEVVIRERRPLVTLRASEPGSESTVRVGSGRRSESILRCPVVAEDRVLGMISVHSYTPDAYGEPDIELVRILAANAATALLNLQFRRALAEKVEQERSAREALSRSEARHRALLEHSHDLTVVVDPSGVLSYVSPSCVRILGYTPADLVGRQVFELVRDSERERAWAAFRERVEGSTPPQLHLFHFRHRDGDWRALEVIGSNLLDHEPVGGIVINARDVSDRAAAEARVEAALRRLRAAQAVSNTGDWEYDLRTGVLNWSAELYRIFGLDAGTPVEYSVYLDRIHPHDRPLLEERVEEARRGGGAYRVDHRVIRPDGSVRHIHGRGVFERDEDGEPVRIFGTAQDVTELRNAEEALRSTEKRMRLFLAQMPALLWMCDRDLCFTWADGAGLGSIGQTPTQYLGASLHEYFGTDDPHFLPIAMHRRALGGEPVSYEMTWEGGTFEAHIEPLRGADGGVIGTLGFALDVSERRSLERQLREAQRMEAIGRLAGGVAHDFNNILTVIDGHANLLLEELREGDPARDDVLQVRSAARRATALTRQLLAFSRRQVLRPRVVDLNHSVQEMERMLQRLIGEDVRLRTDLAGELGRVEVDPSQLEQVLMNLAVNARDAMPKGGTLTITTRDAALPEPQPQTLPDALPAGDFVLLQVADTGHGMDPDVVPRAFEPFFTTKPEGEGTGLGLATVYGIVKQSGGYVGVDSAPGAGARFDLYFPRVEADRTAEGAPTEEPVVGGGETILLVEDEDAVRSLARRVLQRKGYRVLEARNGGEALLLCEAREAPIDLILTDVVMPRMSGTQLVERLARNAPGLRPLFMSGYTEDEVLRRGIVADRVAFLQKPFTPDALARKVRQVLDAG